MQAYQQVDRMAIEISLQIKAPLYIIVEEIDVMSVETGIMKLLNDTSLKGGISDLGSPFRQEALLYV